MYSYRHTSVLPTRPQATDWDVRVPSLRLRPRRVVGMVTRTNRSGSWARRLWENAWGWQRISGVKNASTSPDNPL